MNYDIQLFVLYSCVESCIRIQQCKNKNENCDGNVAKLEILLSLF